MSAMGGVVGKGDRVDRPDLEAEPLQRQAGGGIADMARRYPGLDREDRHGGPLYAPGPGPATRSEERRVGKECVVRVDLGGRRIIKKKNERIKLKPNLQN